MKNFLKCNYHVEDKLNYILKKIFHIDNKFNNYYDWIISANKELYPLYVYLQIQSR